MADEAVDPKPKLVGQIERVMNMLTVF